MEREPTSKIINYDKVVSQLPTFVIENGPEEFWKSAESSPGAPIQNMGFGN